MRLSIFVMSVLSLIASSAGAQTVVSSNVTTNTTWSGTVILESAIFVNNGATLTINPGTIIRGQPRTAGVVAGVTAGTPGALIVTANGTIQANGTAANPIIMTTAAVDNNQDGSADVAPNGFLAPWSSGDTFLDSTPTTAPLAPLNAAGNPNVSLWGGLVILGNAPTNLGNDAGLGEGRDTVEGLTVPGFPIGDATYGGSITTGIPNDSSGSLTYVSVRHAGDEIGGGNELNGVTLAGVGAGTTFSFIEVYANSDDGMEWFGGTVNGDHLAVVFAGDDQFDLDQGYTGTNQFTVNILPYFNGANGSFGASSGDKGCECDGDDSDVALDLSGRPAPFSNADFYNFTSAGSAMSTTFNGHSNDNDGWEVRNGYAGDSFNGVIYNTGGRQGIDVGLGGAAFGFSVVDNAAAGLVTFTAITCDDVTGIPAAPSAENDAVNVFGANNIGCDGVNAAGFGLNQEDTVFTPTGVAGKLNASVIAAPIDLRPLNNATMTGGTVAPPNGEGVSAPYRGAFAPGTGATNPMWTDGWSTLAMAGIMVPEPGTALMLMAGALGLVVMPRRRV